MTRKFIVFLAVLFTAQVSFAQATFKVTVKDENTKEAIAGASVTVKDTSNSVTTDPQGAAQLSNIPDGAHTIVIFSPGYETKELTLTFPVTGQPETLIFLRVTNEVGEVTIISTRTGREIDDVPTRVEAIDEEEVAAGRIPAHGDTYFLVDPLDGTVNYANGIPFYCVSIGLVDNAQPAVGVVFDPARNELYDATADGPARLDGEPSLVNSDPYGEGWFFKVKTMDVFDSPSGCTASFEMARKRV